MMIPPTCRQLFLKAKHWFSGFYPRLGRWLGWGPRSDHSWLLMFLLFSHHQSPVTSRAWNEGETKVREDFTIMEKAPTIAFSWLKAPTTLLHLRHLRYFAKLTLTHGIMGRRFPDGGLGRYWKWVPLQLGDVIVVTTLLLLVSWDLSWPITK